MIRLFISSLTGFTLLASCVHTQRITVEKKGTPVTGSQFYQAASAFGWKQRDSLALEAVRGGSIPSFLKEFVPVKVSIYDSSKGKNINAVYFVSPDYLSLGTDNDWARINITPMAGQQVADLFDCFLPTRKMVDDIYRAAKVKLEPVPMYAFRDSTPTMWHHHLIIEGQRRGRKGLIAGIKKDVVITGRLLRENRSGRVAIYGWHKMNGVPIQPLYTGHINWWVDYSQGIRLILRRMRVDGTWMDYRDVLSHPVLRKLLCDEEFCDHFRY